MLYRVDRFVRKSDEVVWTLKLYFMGIIIEKKSFITFTKVPDTQKGQYYLALATTQSRSFFRLAVHILTLGTCISLRFFDKVNLEKHLHGHKPSHSVSHFPLYFSQSKQTDQTSCQE